MDIGQEVKLMSKIWEPKGNKVQTEIDIEIEYLRKCRRRLNKDIAVLRKTLIEAEEGVAETFHCLNFLLSDVKIVSFYEFHAVKKSHTKFLILKSKHMALIEDALAELKVLNKREEDLLKLREKSKTLILEFKKP